MPENSADSLPERANWLDRLIFIENVTAIIYIGLVLGSIPFADLGVTLGVLLGGGLGLVNIDLLIRIGKKVFALPKRPRSSYFAFTWIKFGLLALILFFAIGSGKFDPVAMVVGLSDFVLGILLGTLVWAVRHPANWDIDVAATVEPPGGEDKAGMPNSDERQ